MGWWVLEALSRPRRTMECQFSMCEPLYAHTARGKVTVGWWEAFSRPRRTMECQFSMCEPLYTHTARGKVTVGWWEAFSRPRRTMECQFSMFEPLHNDTRCYFNVRSKADVGQLNLPHRNNN